MYTEIVAALSNAHRMMEHVLTLIRLQVDMLHPATQEAEFIFLKNAVGYMHNYPGLIHHPAEEIIFEHLIHYAPSTVPICMRLSEQHKQFTIIEVTLLEYVDKAKSGAKGVCEFIKELGNVYCKEHFDHIDSEENEMLPHAIDCIPDEEWQKINNLTNLSLDPLSDPQTLKHYESLYDYLMSFNMDLKQH